MRDLPLALTLLAALAAAPALAQDNGWTGFYGGVSAASNGGTEVYDDDAGDPYELRGSTFGAFGGYLWGNGNLVYGAEAAITKGGVYEYYAPNGTSYEDEYEYQRFFDLKGRIGYAVGNALVYGTLGVSRTTYLSDIGSINQVDTGTTGVLFGLGADYRLADRYFLGAEYLRRNFDFYDAGQDSDIEAEIDSFTLRVGLKF